MQLKRIRKTLRDRAPKRTVEVIAGAARRANSNGPRGSSAATRGQSRDLRFRPSSFVVLGCRWNLEYRGESASNRAVAGAETTCRSVARAHLEPSGRSRKSSL